MKTHHNCGKDLYLGRRIWAMWVWKTNWALVGMLPLLCIPNYRWDVTNCFMTLMLLLNTVMDHNLEALAKIVSSLSDFSSRCFNTKQERNIRFLKYYIVSQILLKELFIPSWSGIYNASASVIWVMELYKLLLRLYKAVI